MVCLDNFRTGRRQNLRHLEREPGFDVVDADVINPLPARLRGGRARFDAIFNLACAASPPHYQANPEHTLLTGVVGTLTVGDLVERVLTLTGSPSTVVTQPLPIDDPRRRRPDISRATKLLGWMPRTPLEMGLKATITWFTTEASSVKEPARAPATLNGAVPV